MNIEKNMEFILDMQAKCEKRWAKSEERFAKSERRRTAWSAWLGKTTGSYPVWQAPELPCAATGDATSGLSRELRRTWPRPRTS